ncbi:ferredoxin [Actinoplanes teichomyceticus]|uniref:Ferredoxin n=1 Tax=Actinoplanes teichomyceticus TaxID=1867 RepID=A0A561VCK0_ACTTI|nr:ferredoxin [Actinoplanes teichomyceticus]TWG09340.1 ferredoxin [Actinoplanes teichomyceticus]GIF16636.1 ferredoxin [Actinoplanes teichomyceticus]
MLTVELDESRCAATGQCVLAAPDVFDQRDDDGVAVVLDDAPGRERHGAVRTAAAACPAAAIRLVES